MRPRDACAATDGDGVGRTGAAAGIVGVLVQSIWETGLRLPANGLLFAALCAIVIYEDEPTSAPRSSQRERGSARHSLPTLLTRE